MGLRAATNVFSATAVDIGMKFFKMNLDGFSDKSSPTIQGTGMVVVVFVSPVIVDMVGGNVVVSNQSFGHFTEKESFPVSGRAEKQITF